MNNTHKEFDMNNMNNMRKGFTMIELIFVIVIIGVLAAVAIPKLASTSEEARKGIMKSFIGTMNRTVGPAMYAKALNQANATGSITPYCAAAEIAKYIDVPVEVTVNTSTCAITESSVGGIATPTTISRFTNGTLTTSPIWTQPEW